MTSFIRVPALLVALLLGTAACDTTIVGGGSDDDEGEGGGGGGDAAGDEADGDEADGDEADGDEAEDDGLNDDGEVVIEGTGACVGPKLEGCLYDVVVCEDGEWVCGDTPLVLSFDGAEPSFLPGATAAFDLAAVGASIATDWPSAATPWLVLDRNGDGVVNDGSELFGSGVRLASGAMASHGFEALAELDANRDGVVDARDPGFARLALWSDLDADRVTDAHELRGVDAGERRLLGIDLAYRVEAVCDARGNCGVERAAFRWRDTAGSEHVGEIVDVHLPRR